MKIIGKDNTNIRCDRENNNNIMSDFEGEKNLRIEK